MKPLPFFRNRPAGVRTVLAEWMKSSAIVRRWVEGMVEGCDGKVGPLHEAGSFLEAAWRLERMAPGEPERILHSWEERKETFRFPAEVGFLQEEKELVALLERVAVLAGRVRMVPVMEFLEAPEKVSMELAILSGRSGGGRRRRYERLCREVERWNRNEWTEKERRILARNTKSSLHAELREAAGERMRREVEFRCGWAAEALFGKGADLSRTDERTRFAIHVIREMGIPGKERLQSSLEGKRWPSWSGTGMTVDDEGPLRVRWRVDSDPAGILFGGERDETICLAADPPSHACFSRARAVLRAENGEGALLDRRVLVGTVDSPEWLAVGKKILPDEAFGEAWERACPFVKGALEGE